MGMQNFLNLHSMSWPKCSCKDKVWKIGTLPASFQHSEIKCSCSQRTIKPDVWTYAKKKLQARNGKYPIQRHHQFWFPAVLVSPHHDNALHWNQWKEISKLEKSNRWGGMCGWWMPTETWLLSRSLEQACPKAKNCAAPTLIHGLRKTQIIKCADSF